MFYDNFIKVCAQHGVSPSFVATELGLNKSSVTNWKKRGASPRDATLQRIADYFNIPVETLTGQKEKPALNNEDELSPVTRELNEIVAGLSEAQAKAALEYIRLLKEAGK